MSRSALPGDLARMAADLGIATTYRDVFGGEHAADPDAVAAVAGALLGHSGVGAGDLTELAERHMVERRRRCVPPVVVSWQPGPVVVAVEAGPDAGRINVTVVADPMSMPSGVSGGVSVVVEVDDRRDYRSGEPVMVDLGSLQLGPGRHQLSVTVEAAATSTSCDATLMVAPRQLPRFGGEDRLWGLFAPVWSAWSDKRPDVHLGQLDAVGAWGALHGARLVGTLPLLSGFYDQFADPSPYSPVSRRWWNEAVVDVRRCPGAADLAWVNNTPPEASVAPPDPAQRWDPIGHWKALRPILARLADYAFSNPGLRSALEAWMRQHPEVRAYAGFRATVERLGVSWHTWDANDHEQASAGDPTDPSVQLWLYAQWAIDTQIGDLTRAMDTRNQLLYLDLALGSHGDGFDTWRSPASFAWDTAVGAPPDALFAGGQNWGFPPVRPHQAQIDGHREFAACLAAHLRHCQVLRLDHVMGLQRLFWIPDGATPADGLYVSQPLEELLAVLSIEAWRHGAVVIGENLGTVDPGVTDAMDTHGLYGMYVGQFEVPDDPDTPMSRPPATVLASLNTHDTPTFPGWLCGDDLQRRHELGLCDTEGLASEQSQRQAQVERLYTELAPWGAPAVESGDDNGRSALLGAWLASLGASDAPAVLVSVDDLAGVVEPQNVPGTPPDRPNWVHRLPVPLEELTSDPGVQDMLMRLAALRMSGVPQ